MHGIMATCQRTQEARCARELTILITEILDQYWPAASDEADDTEKNLSIEEELARERAQLNKRNFARPIKIDRSYFVLKFRA
jgi:hypothetical protein